MDRAFTLDAPVELVWPWFVQLGKRRAGWYLPRRIERFIPPPRRAIRTIDPEQVAKIGSAEFYASNGPRFKKGMKKIG